MTHQPITRPLPVVTQPLPQRPAQGTGVPSQPVKYPIPNPATESTFQRAWGQGMQRARENYAQRYDAYVEYQNSSPVPVPVTRAEPEMRRGLGMLWQQQPGAFREGLDMKVATGVAAVSSDMRLGAGAYMLAGAARMDGKLIGHNVMSDGSRQQFFSRRRNELEWVIYLSLHLLIVLSVPVFFIEMQNWSQQTMHVQPNGKIVSGIIDNDKALQQTAVYFLFTFVLHGFVLLIDYYIRRSNRREVMFVTGALALISGILFSSFGGNSDDHYERDNSPLENPFSDIH